MTQLDDIKIPLEIDTNMILIDLAQHSVYIRDIMNGWWLVWEPSFDSLSADHVMIESEIQHWLNEYIQLHFSDRR